MVKKNKIKKKEIIKMEHNNFEYELPILIERNTRLFPLIEDKESIIYSTKLCPTLKKSYKNLIDIILKNKITDDEKKEAKRLLINLYNCAQNNDINLVPEFINDHTKRFDIFKKFWGEIRILIITMDQKDLRNIVDDLWPQFFIEKSKNLGKFFFYSL
jgi:hypothetical protein